MKHLDKGWAHLALQSKTRYYRFDIIQMSQTICLELLAASPLALFEPIDGFLEPNSSE